MRRSKLDGYAPRYPAQCGLTELSIFRAERSIEGGRFVTIEHILLAGLRTQMPYRVHRGYHGCGLVCRPCRSAGVSRCRTVVAVIGCNNSVYCSIC